MVKASATLTSALLPNSRLKLVLIVILIFKNLTAVGDHLSRNPCNSLIKLLFMECLLYARQTATDALIIKRFKSMVSVPAL